MPENEIEGDILSCTMSMNVVQSSKVKDSKSIYKEKITSSITPYWLVWEVQWIKEALWERKNKFKEFALSGIHDSMCFLMTECRIICGKLLFWCELSKFWGFMITDEKPHPPNCVVMTIFQVKMNHNRALSGRLCRSVN